MRIDKIRTIAGPNIYTHKPVLVTRLFLEELTDVASTEIPGFIDRLLAMLPGIHEHRCSRGRPGGFNERLREGTYFAHIVEHVALELTEHAGIPSYFGRARYGGEPGCYNVIVEYKAEQGARFLLNVAVELVAALVAGDPYPLEEKIKEARRIINETELGPSTRAIVDAATWRGIPWFRIGTEASLVQLGYGKNRRHIQAAVCDRTRAIAVEVAGDKELTKTLLEQVSIPVPRGIVTKTWDEAVDALERIGAPVVVKPLDGRQGKGVSLNLTTPEEVAHAFHIAKEFSDYVLVEELFEGRNYRVLVVDGRVVAASERMAAHVVGDGFHTITELIEMTNLDPARGEGHEKPLTRIVVDEIVQAYLLKSGLTLEHIPHAGEVVYLREGINLSTGGTAKDVTDIVHTSVAEMCVRAARVIGMDVCGVDLVLRDISEPMTKTQGGVIELNASPGLRMHLYPSEGQPRDVGGAVIDMMYPPGTPSRIPIISVTGTNGKTTVTRMIGHVLSEARQTVGMTTTDGIYIAGERIVEGDTTGPHSARTVLSDPSVEIAVLETARGGIARRGLGYDWSDTNIQPDHIGQDGIESVEDILHIKSLVAERVREGGTLILNADDEHLTRLIENPRVSRLSKQVIYFSLHENHLLIKKHMTAQGLAYYVKNGWIVEANGSEEHPVIHVNEIPTTLNGAAEFNVANSLAAVAACRAYGVTREQVAASLRRGSVTESSHYGHIVAVDGGGHVVAELGAPERMTYLRSSAKPFQAIPLITTGAADRFSFSTQEVAIACGSHNGDPEHTRTVQSMLRKIGLDESALKCGTHEPYSPEAARELRERGEKPNVLHNNCSGKHAGMLALAVHLGVGIETYEKSDHPVQVAITRTVAQFSCLPLKSIPIGVDGCGVPVHGMPVRAMAEMYARLITPPENFDHATRAACERITGAMKAYPEMIGGETESLDTALMRIVPGGLIAKAGAEGLFTAGIMPSEKWPRGLGLALKIDDGDKGGRARRPAVIETLRQLGVLSDTALGALSSYAKPIIRNHRGEVVGETVAHFEFMT
jgi:cyanophycin synthetase